MPRKSYRELVAWQKGMDLATWIYQVTVSWPKAEIYGLTSQIRRAAVSVPANIAEGQGRRTPTQFRYFLSIAFGSLLELETILLLAMRLGYSLEPDGQEGLRQAEEVGRLLSGLTRSLEEQ